jgi:RNA polymerase sigma-70 factor, ECF subfamily
VIFMSDAARWQWLVDGLRRGDQQVALAFCKEFAEPLERLADRRLVGGLRRRVGAEDVVQSVCRTFLRRMSAGEFQLPDSESLWRLLCAITLSKISKQARWHQRQKRNVDQEISLEALELLAEGMEYQFEAPGPLPDEAAAFADQFQQLIESLDGEEGRIIDLKLQQYTNEEAAARIGCSERTVRRLLKRVQDRLKGAFAE